MSIGKRVLLKVTKIGRYNRTTVPEEVRKLLDLHEGDEIAWIFEGSRIIVEKRNKNKDKR